MSKQELKQKGFTIIEVVLVLAIAALIFLMVFIALPALQRNQRDTARKTVSSKVASAIQTYQSNKRGIQPTKGNDLNGYIDGVNATAGEKGETDQNTLATATDSYVDGNYIVRVNAYASGSTVGVADRNFIQIFTGAKCNASGDAAMLGSKKNAAVLIKMENGDAVVCESV